MALGVALIGGYFVVELITGIVVGSLALIADAGHMLTDVVALCMGLVALLLARHGKTTGTRSFGWHRAEVFTAAINALLLFGVAGYVLYEAIERLGTDPEVPGATLIIVAAIGLAVNVAVMFLLRADSKESIAVRGAYMEVLADAVGSVGVLVAGVVMITTGWGYADIVVAVCIALWVVPRALSLLLDAARILSQQAPRHIDVDEVRREVARAGRRKVVPSSERHHERSSGYRIVNNHAAHAVDPLNQIRRHNLFRRPLRHYLTVSQGNQMRGVAARLV